MANDPDEEQLDKVLAGDMRAYGIIVDRYKSYVVTIAYKILLVRSDAEEAAQDAFIKAFKALKDFNREAKFSTWLYRIAFNTAISYKRRQKPVHFNIEETVIGQSHEGENSLEKRDKKKFVHEALNRLTEADRSMLTLFYLQEFSLEEIADITGSPANTIKVRIHRARQRMGDELSKILKQETLTL